MFVWWIDSHLAKMAFTKPLFVCSRDYIMPSACHLEWSSHTSCAIDDRARHIDYCCERQFFLTQSWDRFETRGSLAPAHLQKRRSDSEVNGFVGCYVRWPRSICCRSIRCVWANDTTDRPVGQRQGKHGVALIAIWYWSSHATTHVPAPSLPGRPGKLLLPVKLCQKKLPDRAKGLLSHISSYRYKDLPQICINILQMLYRLFTPYRIM